MMNKALLYHDKLFANARSFHQFILDNVFDGNEPNNWNLEYVAVCFSKRARTISGIKVSWVTIDLTTYDQLMCSKTGWMKWTNGEDKTFLQFVYEQNKWYTKEELWRWVIDYVITYDISRMAMKRLVDEVLNNSEVVGKKQSVKVYRIKELINDKQS